MNENDDLIEGACYVGTIVVNLKVIDGNLYNNDVDSMQYGDGYHVEEFATLTKLAEKWEADGSLAVTGEGTSYGASLGGEIIWRRTGGLWKCADNGSKFTTEQVIENWGKLTILRAGE